MLRSGLGLACLIFLAWCLSQDRRRVPWRMITGGLGLQFGIAGLVLKVPAFNAAFMGLNSLVQAAETATRAGTSFVFGFVGGGPTPYVSATPSMNFSLAFQALPLVIVIAALTSLLFHLGILQRLVRLFSLVLEKTMGIGGALGVGAAGTIFLGMIESPLLIRPYLSVFVALVKLVNLGLATLPDVAGAPVTLQRGLGVLLSPVAWLIGVPWAEAQSAGALIGTKIVLNEFLAFIDMAALPPDALSAGTRLILTYAMCSFANFGSLGILIAGLSTLCPERRSVITGLGMRALLAGVIASLMTGAVVGIISRL